jgi:flavodoxin
MRKVFKIVAAVIIAIIILVVAFVAVAFLDLAAYTATGSQTLTPTGTSLGKAIVVYDPGLSGAAKGVADKVASDLQASGYTVTLAGIKSSAATHIAGYSIIVVGGPVYGGSLTASVRDCLNNLKPDQGVKIGVFGSSGGSTTPSGVTMLRNSVSALSNNGTLLQAIAVKIGQSENLTARASDFVSQLTS